MSSTPHRPDLGATRGSPHTARAGRELREVLGRARRLARRRLALVAVVDLGIAASLWTMLSVLGAALTLRGDLLWWPWALGIVGLAAALGARAIRRARADYGDEWRTAATIARTRGPVAHRPIPDEASELRHEIEAAADLARRLSGEPGPDHGHLGSSELARHYVARLETRLRHVELGLLVPRPDWRTRGLIALAMGLVGGMLQGNPDLQQGATLLREARDGRPPEPPRPLWSSLELTLVYPPHTHRPSRVVPNPSGALRVPAGTEIAVRLRATEGAEAGRLVLVHDPEEQVDAPAPARFDLDRVESSDEGAGDWWQGRFTARGSGTWSVLLLDDPSDSASARRSVPLTLELEVDAPPEVELRPLPESRQKATETDTVPIRFAARDDFGLGPATLVYELPDGTTHRIPGGEPAAGRRTWKHRVDWDLSTIPIEQRAEVVYWIEIRDTDPGLGLTPLPDPPGKVTRSARQKLVVEDEEAEHARNIQSLRELRDRAVDLLAARLITKAFDDDTGQAAAIREAREVHAGGEGLLISMAATIDDLSVDTMTRERDVATLAAVHARLDALFDQETTLHEDLPPGIEHEVEIPGFGRIMGKLDRHNDEEIEQLEDEIIRLDDLVDGQIIERMEALIARLKASQQKLVELLEQLQAGDESVKPQIQQLQQRIRDDQRRLRQARAMLGKELGEEFMNLDAFRALQKRLEAQDIQKRLEEGDIDRALEEARENLEGLQEMQDAVQDRMGQEGEASRLSPEQQARMKLLRELSRLQDEQTALRGQARRLHEQWREAVDDVAAEDAEAAGRDAAKLREQIGEVNDARLGRDAREAWEDALEALESLESRGGQDDATALELFEAAQRARRALDRASAGAPADGPEGRALRRAQKRAATLEKKLRGPLPGGSDVLDEEALESLDETRRRQAGLDKKARDLLADPVAEQLPDAGLHGMKKARKGMREGAGALERGHPDDALPRQQTAWDGLQQAIDSLREASPPPPPPSGGDSSTEAERDRSLRDELMETMREEAPEGYDDAVKHYYEELLR